SVIRYKFTDGDSLYGTGVDYYGGYERENKTYYLWNLKQDDFKDYIQSLVLGESNRFSLKNFSIEGLHHPNDNLTIHYDFAVDNLGIKDGEEIILNPAI